MDVGRTADANLPDVGTSDDASTSRDASGGGDANGSDAAVSDAGRIDAARPDAASVDAAVSIDASRPPDMAVATRDAGRDAATRDSGASVCVTPTAGQLVISEWMPDPSLVSDANGEWFEILATADVDLNGFSAGASTLTVLVPAAGPCVRLSAGSRAVFARRSDPAMNGMIPGAIAGTFTFALVQSAGTLMIGTGTTMLDSVTWATSTAGRSIMFDSSRVQCNAPTGVAAYNGTDVGTPNAANTPPECP